MERESSFLPSITFSPPTPILLFLAQEKTYFPHEVTILATGSSLWGGGSCLAVPVPHSLLSLVPTSSPDESFLLCWNLELTKTSSMPSLSQLAFKAKSNTASSRQPALMPWAFLV